MNDREKLMVVIDTFADRYEEKKLSVLIYGNRTKILFTPEGEIKTVIRAGVAYGPEGKRR